MTSTTKSTKTKKKWFPLESNPNSLNHYISKLGFNTSLYSFVDVYSTDDETLSYMAQSGSCIGIIMLYPLTEVQEEHRHTEATLKNENDSESNEDNIWFIKQRIGNSCGTIGILNTLGNIPQPFINEIAFAPSSWLQNFYKQTPISMDAIEKAEILESNDEIEKHHDESTSNTQLNQTSRGGIDDKVLTHFISIVNVNNEVYELDGRKDGPICHGQTSEETFLYDGIKVVKKFMARDPNEYRFTILALMPTQE